MRQQEKHLKEPSQKPILQAVISAIMLSLCLMYSTHSFSQNTEAKLDKLSFTIEGEWSRKIEQQRVIYDDYNLTGKHSKAIVLYHFTTADDPKQFFASAWQSIMPDTVAVPRPRRLYTSNSDLIWLSAAAYSLGDQTGYAQLYVFTKPEGYQCVLVWLDSFEQYRKTQSQWNIMMQDAKLQ